ncbi:hypothetical protein [Paenibacillus sp. LHD-38]|uniref:hypothetical protein n=1 Tax=Paenibacillus sp. LHD-38 TaxID=3072143 RepID=UPI00280F7DD8|nr:hypothetical protein [Paenibacillus sp. LHD-38]MDQ8735647.1 hypothetical protein [Paenibacillus sp. LHD-38]
MNVRQRGDGGIASAKDSFNAGCLQDRFAACFYHSLYLRRHRDPPPVHLIVVAVKSCHHGFKADPILTLIILALSFSEQYPFVSCLFTLQIIGLMSEKLQTPSFGSSAREHNCPFGQMDAYRPANKKNCAVLAQFFKYIGGFRFSMPCVQVCLVIIAFLTNETEALPLQRG